MCWYGVVGGGVPRMKCELVFWRTLKRPTHQASEQAQILHSFFIHTLMRSKAHYGVWFWFFEVNVYCEVRLWGGRIIDGKFPTMEHFAGLGAVGSLFPPSCNLPSHSHSSARIKHLCNTTPPAYRTRVQLVRQKFGKGSRVLVV